MAIDTWLWEQHHLGQMPPCLRFYQWHPAAISYGYHQKNLPEHWQNLAWEGTRLEAVRRPTGGRAVLHQGDLTYALVTTLPQASRRAAYEQLSEFLIQGFQKLGIHLRLGSEQRNYQQSPNCFATPTTADLVLDNGYKLIGSAQAWKGQTVLQHGSIRLNPNPNLWQQVFQAPLPAPPKNLPSPDILVATFIKTFQELWAVEFQSEPLSPTEWPAIEQIQHQQTPVPGLFAPQTRRVRPQAED